MATRPDDPRTARRRTRPVGLLAHAGHARGRLHPGERFDSKAHQPGVTETLTVVRGQVMLFLGETAPTLRAGATGAYAAEVPHAYQGVGRGPCELIMTIHLPKEHRSA